jgi:hypothetical protein
MVGLSETKPAMRAAMDAMGFAAPNPSYGYHETIMRFEGKDPSNSYS